MIDPAHLSAYIASRICHDLVSPVASVSSALDFMDEPQDSGMREQAEQLLRKGASDASARLQFLRYAFGSMGLSDGTADMHEAKRIAEGFVATHKPSIDWQIEPDQLSFAHVRLMMNLLILGIDCLPRGGVISVRVTATGDTLVFTLVSKGPRAKLREDIGQALGGDAPEGGWSARSVQPLFTRMIADSLGGAVTAKQAGDEEVVVQATGIQAVI